VILIHATPESRVGNDVIVIVGVNDAVPTVYVNDDGVTEIAADDDVMVTVSVPASGARDAVTLPDHVLFALINVGMLLMVITPRAMILNSRGDGVA
jgi:hypothetical protein